jgi:hypothetical protein
LPPKPDLSELPRDVAQVPQADLDGSAAKAAFIR